MTYFLNICFFCALLLLSTSCSSNLTRYSYESRQMGIDFRIDVYAANEHKAKRTVDKAFKRISELNMVMSDYKVDSELWQLFSSHNEDIKVSDDLWYVLQKSRYMHKVSDGAFDITAGRYTMLWRQAIFAKSMPLKRSLERAHGRVGLDKLVFDHDKQTVRLTVNGMRLDLGGIAKGYAADEALKVIKAEGLKYAIVDGGGDMAMTRHPNAKWNVYISDSLKGKLKVRLSAGAIATSGDSYQGVDIDGKRYSHIVNPKTGLGITNRCRVTVIAQDCLLADSLASAISVLGPEKGLKLAESLKNVDVLVSQTVNNKEKIFKSSGFPDLVN